MILTDCTQVECIYLKTRRTAFNGKRKTDYERTKTKPANWNGKEDSDKGRTLKVTSLCSTTSDDFVR